MSRWTIHLRFLLSILLALAAAGGQAAAIAPLPELSPLPMSQKLATMSEPLPVETIVDAALEFSGATDASAAAAKDKLSGLLVRFRDEVADINGQAELGERALTFLHKNLFTSYSVFQTRVDTALETGVYNCVSSAVLYLIVASSVGLSVTGVRTTDHAFDTVLVNGQFVDVETTNPYGFNPGSHKDFTDSFGRLTGFNYVPPGNYGDRKSIGEKELLSLILYNRVSEYGDGGSFRDALQPAVSAFTLMGTDETKKVMTMAFSNYVTWMGMRQDFAQAIQFIETAKGSFGGIVELEQSRRDIYHNWAVNLLDSSAFADAEALLSQTAVHASLEATDWTNLSIELAQRRAQIEVGANGYLSAAGMLAESMKRLGRLTPLLQGYEAYVHNAFAQLYNTKKFADALAAVQQGLAVYPESKILQQDLDLIKRTARQ